MKSCFMVIDFINELTHPDGKSADYAAKNKETHDFTINLMKDFLQTIKI